MRKARWLVGASLAATLLLSACDDDVRSSKVTLSEQRCRIGIAQEVERKAKDVIQTYRKSVRGLRAPLDFAKSASLEGTGASHFRKASHELRSAIDELHEVLDQRCSVIP